MLVECKSIVLCEECSNDSYTPKHKQFMARMKYLISDSEPGSWFLGTFQCHVCGTTEYGRRFKHGFKTLSSEEAERLSQPITPEFTEYDKQLAYALGVKI